MCVVTYSGYNGTKILKYMQGVCKDLKKEKSCNLFNLTLPTLVKIYANNISVPTFHVFSVIQ